MIEAVVVVNLEEPEAIISRRTLQHVAWLGRVKRASL